MPLIKYTNIQLINKINSFIIEESGKVILKIQLKKKNIKIYPEEIGDGICPLFLFWESQNIPHHSPLLLLELLSTLCNGPIVSPPPTHSSFRLRTVMGQLSWIYCSVEQRATRTHDATTTR